MFINKLVLRGAGNVEIQDKRTLSCPDGFEEVDVQGTTAYVTAGKSGGFSIVNSSISIGGMSFSGGNMTIGGRSMSSYPSISTTSRGMSISNWNTTTPISVNGKDMTSVLREALLGKSANESPVPPIKTTHTFDRDMMLSDVKVEGSSDIELSQDVVYTPDLSLQVAGSGTINLLAENVIRLKAMVAGSGDIIGNTTCQYLNLMVAGSGDITGFHGVKEIVASVAGSGDIKVTRTRECFYDPSTSGSGSIKAPVRSY